MKQWRLEKEFSRERMAQKCGVHRNTYAAWEENSDNISVKNAKIITGAFNPKIADTVCLNMNGFAPI